SGGARTRLLSTLEKEWVNPARSFKGQVWTAPAARGEPDYQRSVRVQGARYASVGQQRPGDASHLVGKRHRRDLEGPSRQPLRDPRILIGVPLGSLQHSVSAYNGRQSSNASQSDLVDSRLAGPDALSATGHSIRIVAR